MCSPGLSICFQRDFWNQGLVSGIAHTVTLPLTGASSDQKYLLKTACEGSQV